jgi:hypothetical protein
LGLNVADVALGGECGQVNGRECHLRQGDARDADAS